MSPSNSLLDNRFFDKLSVNRLQAIEIRSNNILQIPSYLYSLVFYGIFERKNNLGILTIEKNNYESGIVFSDRPLRQTNDKLKLEEFTSLFRNTFEKQPPNGVLVHSEEQRTYKITLNEETNEYSKFNLELLPGETHNLSTVNSRMSFFVDNGKNPITIDNDDRTLSTISNKKVLISENEKEVGLYNLELDINISGVYKYIFTSKDNEVYYISYVPSNNIFHVYYNNTFYGAENVTNIKINDYTLTLG